MSRHKPELIEVDREEFEAIIDRSGLDAKDREKLQALVETVIWPLAASTQWGIVSDARRRVALAERLAVSRIDVRDGGGHGIANHVAACANRCDFCKVV